MMMMVTMMECSREYASGGNDAVDFFKRGDFYSPFHFLFQEEEDRI